MSTKKKTTELAVQEEPNELSVPAFMQGDTDLCQAMVQKFFVPPVLKIVQKQSDSELHEFFNTGDTILLPSKQVIAPVAMNKNGKPDKYGEPFHFTPVFFWPEWALCNPISLRGKEPFIVERSLDEDSDIAVCARDRSSWLREHPEHVGAQPPVMQRYVEFLNFIVVLHGVDDLEATPVVISFSKASHKYGRQLCNLLQIRRKAPMYGQRYSIQAMFESNDQGEWFSWIPGNPIDGAPFVTDPNEYAVYKELHERLADLHQNRLIQVDHDVDGETSSREGTGEF